jgi:eukaryotic-like serine/threonine-protein kinase
MAPMRGVADYEFLRELGGGGRGRYFLARRPPRLPPPVEFVAVKVFSQESTSDTFRRAALRLRTFGSARSPYLGGVYDIGQHDGIIYSTMELIAGGSLVAPTQPVDRALRVRAVSDTARGLSALHLSGFVHSGVKPGNVLLDAYGAKVADPDLSQLFAPGQRHAGIGRATSVEFADPDQLLGAPPAPEHDVWSVGLLLHWVVTGSTGYPGLPTRDGLAALRAVISGRPRIGTDIPEAVAGIVRDCVAAPADRPTAAVVADRIAEIASAMATESAAR